MSTGKISLSWLVASVSAVIVGAFMFFHDVYLGNLAATEGLPQRLLSHGWHVAVYFVTAFALMNAILQRILVRPVQKLYLQLYALSKGEIAPIMVHSRVAEIQEIESGINMIIDHLPSQPGETCVEWLASELHRLRMAADQLIKEAEPECREALLRTAARIDDFLAEDRGEATPE